MSNDMSTNRLVCPNCRRHDNLREEFVEHVQYVQYKDGGPIYNVEPDPSVESTERIACECGWSTGQGRAMLLPEPPKMTPVEALELVGDVLDSLPRLVGGDADLDEVDRAYDLLLETLEGA